MRSTTKYRLIYFTTLVLTYFLGFQLIPESLTSQRDNIVFSLFCLAYFVFLPFSHWICIIKAGKQKLWRIIVPLSISSFMARYSFPSEIASYFEFMAWLRYPIIAVLLILEFYLMFTVIKGLWSARKLKGDPRINALKMHSGEKSDDKKRTLALVLALEPASWYYAIPWLSKQHVQTLTNIHLHSAKRWHYIAVLTTLFLCTAISYWLLAGYSQWGAIALAALIFYGIILLTANHRLSRYYSCYITPENQLILNNSVWGFMCVPVSRIQQVSRGEFSQAEHSNALFLGKRVINKKHGANIQIDFNSEQTYYSALGQLSDAVCSIYVSVDDPQALVVALQSANVNQ